MERETSQGLVLEVAAANERFDPEDDRWSAQASEFARQLRQEVPETERHNRAVAGTKGAVTDLILALGTSGALETAIAFFRAWLGRDKDRRLSISWEEDGHKRSISIRGADMTTKSFEALASAAATRLES